MSPPLKRQSDAWEKKIKNRFLATIWQPYDTEREIKTVRNQTTYNEHQLCHLCDLCQPDRYEEIDKKKQQIAGNETWATEETEETFRNR